MRFVFLALGLIVAFPPRGNAVFGAEAEVMIVDEAGQSHRLTAADIAKLPQRTLKAKAHDAENEFSGVSLVDLLQSVGVEFGDKLKGARAGTVLVVEAADGYRTAFALLEIDPATTDKIVLLADKKNSQPLDDKEGPLRLVAPDEKRPIRWVRCVKTLRVINVKDLPPLEKTALTGSNQN
ncbi:MAG TPA: molybdopterin-dependent oxidoreductase [Pirellulales bacterium]|nr:molybdopterin-dependent oxidoreductase [Pirellulales bacterium]